MSCVIKLLSVYETESKSIRLIKSAHHQIRIVEITKHIHDFTLKTHLLKQNTDISSIDSSITVIRS